MFASFGAAVAIPHQEDSGIDLHCTLTERVGQRAWPRSYFSVQVKSTTDAWDFKDAVQWLIEYPLPLFLCVVDKASTRLWNILRFWAGFDLENLDRIRAGIDAFRIPSTYVTNTEKVDGWAIQGTNQVPDLGSAKEHIRFALLARCDSVRRSLLTSARHGS